MNETIKAAKLENVRDNLQNIFTLNDAKITRAFHQTFPEYQPTPLRNLKNLAHELGVNAFFVKDESYRFGLNAFKSLGGSFCLGKYIAERLVCDISELSYSKITSPEIKSKLGEITFVTATDGNHGRGIAWAANRLGHKAVVYMPAGTVEERLKNIIKLGADASITEFNYDNTVRFAADNANKSGWILVQDTSWPDYEKIPRWIMQGYLTMALEAVEQLNGVIPTHVFLQAGVGSMAGALAAFFADYYKDNKPVITIIEPNKADCIYRTARADDGNLHTVKGSMNTIMAGLACGEPCTVAWEMLRRYAEIYVSMPDYVAAKGMRVLANPLGDDGRIISGESGASTSGFVCELLQNQSLDYLREMLEVGSDSRLLCFSTEGDTDRRNYRSIVWDGLHPSF
ncbi:MAG: diaminopropionate ammonia-lyase [Synergistaceae bacterium]|nr:diaminopropionate ammonia-lyase [Synergistaceae bacterium]